MPPARERHDAVPPAPARLVERDNPDSAQWIRVTKRIRHRWRDLFDLVLDVKSYPEFVPHCRAVMILSRRLEGNDDVILSRMTVGLAALELDYANRTRGDIAARTITVEAVDGPLRRLDVVWRFEPAGEHTDVSFAVDYAFDSAILSTLVLLVFDVMFRETVDAFAQRADRLFGRG